MVMLVEWVVTVMGLMVMVMVRFARIATDSGDGNHWGVGCNCSSADSSEIVAITPKGRRGFGGLR